MKVFISWSGDRSKEVARHVKTWVGQVFQGTDVFMSDEDISAGTNWSERIKRELANTTIGIVCMTPENQDAKWINYEMGALSKEVKDGQTRVIPLLIGFAATGEVGQPAASLNMVMLNKRGLKKVAYSLNDVSDVKRERAELDMVTETWWPILGEKMETAAQTNPPGQPKIRNEVSMVEEVLNTVRNLSKRMAAQSDIERRIVATGDLHLFGQIIRSSMASLPFGYVGAESSMGGVITVKTQHPISPEAALDVASKIRTINPEIVVNFKVFDEQEIERLEEEDEFIAPPQEPRDYS